MLPTTIVARCARSPAATQTHLRTSLLDARRPWPASHARGGVDSGSEGLRVRGLATLEPSYRRIFGEMKDARERRTGRFGAADVDNRRILELLGQNIQRKRSGVWVERFEHLVDQYPTRGMQQKAREYQALLLVVTQFAVPAPR